MPPPLPGPTGLLWPTEVARWVAEGSCRAARTPPGLPSSVRNEPTQPFGRCGTELVSAPVPWQSRREVGMDQPWLSTGTGSSRDNWLERWQSGFRGAAVVLSASAEPRKMSGALCPLHLFFSPVRNMEGGSPPLPPPSSPQHPSASLGWISSIPKQFLLHRQYCSCPCQS